MFEKIVAPFVDSGMIENLYFGHEHVILTRIAVASASSKQALFMHGSISPVYNNNPTFRIYEVGDGQESSSGVQDFTDYVYNLSASAPLWKPLYKSGSYGTDYNLSNVNDASALAQSVSTKMLLYAENSIAKAPFASCGQPDCPKTLYCNILNLVESSYETCVNNQEEKKK